MTTSPAPHDPDATVDLDATTPTTDPTEPIAPHATGSPDPITGEPDAHPVGVGVGAGIAGAMGAAIGAVAGPIGMMVGVAIGAIAGGLAGKEVAETPEITPTPGDGSSLDDFDRPGLEDQPLSAALAERVSPPEDAFFTGGTVTGKDADAPLPALDSFDHASGSAPVAEDDVFADDKPLPTASGGLITPDESSFFEDSAAGGLSKATTGESPTLTESPFTAARAVSPGDHFADTPISASSGQPTYTTHIDTEQTIRTGAYYRYLDRESVGQPGSEFDDWIAAEKEVLGGS